MRLTLVTHNDTDGYCAMIGVARRRRIAKTIHVARYADVGDVLEGEVARLTKARDAEELVVTDISVEPRFVGAIRGFAAMNRKRDDPHRMTVLDHHLSSVDALRLGGLRIDEASPTRVAANLPLDLVVPTQAPWFECVVDTEKSATRLAFEHFDGQAGDVTEPVPEREAAVRFLVHRVDAVDLWRRDRPEFDVGSVVSDAFFDTKDEYVPSDHEDHDAFLTDLMIRLAAKALAGATPRELEDAVPATRREAMESLFARREYVEDEEQRGRSVRLRLAGFLARSKGLFAEPAPGVRMAYAMAPGLFQKTVDVVLESKEVEMAVNVMSSGSASFRSRGGQALEAARRFGGGGHGDSSGAKVSRRRISSLVDAVETTRDRIGPPASPLGGAFAAALAKASRK